MWQRLPHPLCEVVSIGLVLGLIACRFGDDVGSGLGIVAIIPCLSVYVVIKVVKRFCHEKGQGEKKP